MTSRFYGRSLFANLFTLGLLLLFIEALGSSLQLFSLSNFFTSVSKYIFAAGVTICAVSCLFLLIEWVMVPFGIQTKRIKLYQGAGNILAFAMLIGGYLFRADVPQDHLMTASMTVSSSGLGLALLFSWLGGSIAEIISRKKINLDGFSRRRLPLKNESIVSSTIAEAKKIGETMVGSIQQNRAAQN